MTPNQKNNARKKQFNVIIDVICLALLIVPAITYFPELDLSIPKHYGIDGTPDSYGNRTSILIMPIIGIIVYSIMSMLHKHPEVFNYPIKITKENKDQLYKLGQSTIRNIKLIVIIGFASLNFFSIRIGMGLSQKLPLYIIPTFVILLILISIMYIKKMKQLKK